MIHSVGFPQVNENVLSLDQLIKMAIEENPQLQSFHSATLADSARIPQSGALPDPILSLNLLNLPTNSFSFDQEPMTGKQIALRQLFPFPGKLSLKEKISSENAAISIANYHEYKNQLIKELKQAYYDLFFIDKSIEITKKNRRLLEKYAKIAETKYSVGKGIQQDVLKAQVEYSKMSDKLIQLEQKREVKQAQINTLINAPVNSKLGKTVEPEFFPVDENLDTLKIIASRYRPLIKGWESMKKQSNLKVNLAKKAYWPDIGLFIAYTQRDELQNGNPGYDFLSGGISLNIPIYSGIKQSQKVEETQFTRIMIDERYTQVLNQVFYELENTRSNVNKNVRLVELFKTEIIPQASQSVESALVGYQTDKVDFLTLINNQITLFNYDIDYYRVLSDYNKDIASLEFLTGVKFDKGRY
jgi:outer membrane protein TolC